MGGGIAGMAAAIRLNELARESSIELRLFESSSRLGGTISTSRWEDCLLENGPEAIFTEKPWGTDFCRKLGLENEIIHTNREGRRSFIWSRGKLIPFSSGIPPIASSRPFASPPLFSWRSTDSRGPRYHLFISLKGGMQSLVERAAAQLPAGCVRLNSPVSKIGRTEEGTFRIETPGAEWVSDAVCLAAPAFVSAALLKNIEPEPARGLGQIRALPAVTVNLVYKKDSLPPLDGFGFIVPEKENTAILGCTYASQKFPGRAPDHLAVLRAYLIGKSCLKKLELPDEEIREMVRGDLETTLGIRAVPVFSQVARLPGSIPQYAAGHADRIAVIEEGVAKARGIALAGNSFYGVGIPDCIRSGEEAAERIFEGLGSVARLTGLS